MGIPEYEAKRYEGRVKHGGILLSVHCDNHDWAKRAEKILKTSGAEDISSTHEAGADFATSDKPMPRTRSTITPGTEERIEPVVATDVDREVATEINDRPRTRTTGGF
jgi:hypothetical protein